MQLWEALYLRSTFCSLLPPVFPLSPTFFLPRLNLPAKPEHRNISLTFTSGNMDPRPSSHSDHRASAKPAASVTEVLSSLSISTEEEASSPETAPTTTQSSANVSQQQSLPKQSVLGAEQASLDNLSCELKETSCPLCKKGFSDRTKLLPCGHNYDYRCIQEWLVDRHNSCVICRSVPSALLRNVDDEDQKFIQPIHECKVSFDPRLYLDINVPMDNHIVQVQRSIKLDIQQMIGVTTSKLVVTLMIKHSPRSPQALAANKYDTDAESRLCCQIAVKSAHVAVWDWFPVPEHLDYQPGDFEGSHNLRWDPNPIGIRGTGDRGILYMHVKHRIRAWERVEDRMTKIEFETELREADPGKEDNPIELPKREKDRSRFGNLEERKIAKERKKVKAATERIRSALKWLRGPSQGHDGLLYSHLDSFASVSGFDCDITNILQAEVDVSPMQCGRCPAKHKDNMCLGHWP